MSTRRKMTLEEALDEEAREVVAILEGKKAPASPHGRKAHASPHERRTHASPHERRAHASPHAATRVRTASPATGRQSPVRSLLKDLAPGIPRSQHLEDRRASSTTGEGRRSATSSPTGSTFSEPAQVRSMLDFNSPPPSAGLPRPHRLSHGSTSPGLPTIHQGLPSPKHNIEDAYQFEIPSNIDAYTTPRRVSHGAKPKGAMAGVLAPDGSRLPQPRESKSRSPAHAHGARSASPSTRLLKSSSPTSKNGAGTYVSESGKVIDLNNAYRRLSDAALAKSGGSLAELPQKKGVNVETGEELAPDGGVRLTKDYSAEEALDSSDQESGASSGEELDIEQRGRRRTRKSSRGSGTALRPHAKSLMAAAEEESKQIYERLKRKGYVRLDTIDETVEERFMEGKAFSSTNNVRSLIDVTNPKKGYIQTPKKGGIHPRTSFDVGGASGISTPVDSDEEQTRTDFNTAQKMALTLSPIHSSPEAHRCIRQILRGDFRKYQTEAEQGLRRQRMYLVATDLSEEAAYALEWTIGTVLRDGDTLLGVYAVDEEAGTGGGDTTTTANNSVGIGEGSNQMKEAAAIVRTLSNQQGLVVPGEAPRKPSTDGGRSPSHVRSHSLGRYSDKAERERYYATEEITDRCVKLLRKTKLQVRVVVEVFHCKSPKHMITEVIDYLEPTLVILGSRGRSALKGVLLGSFSNYLVTKSSVPVMVARKKLRKHSKLKRTNLRLSNMLQTPGNRLESAVVDRPNMGTRRNSQS